MVPSISSAGLSSRETTTALQRSRIPTNRTRDRDHHRRPAWQRHRSPRGPDGCAPWLQRRHRGGFRKRCDGIGGCIRRPNADLRQAEPQTAALPTRPPPMPAVLRGRRRPRRLRPSSPRAGPISRQSSTPRGRDTWRIDPRLCGHRGAVAAVRPPRRPVLSSEGKEAPPDLTGAVSVRLIAGPVGRRGQPLRPCH